MKILLLRPNDLNRERLLGRRLGGAYPPLGLLYLAAVLEREGVQTELCDEMIGDSTPSRLDTLKPDLVGITLCTPLVPRAREIVAACRARSIRTLIGGPHVSSDPERALVETGADLAAFGEAESAMAELARGSDPRGIQGLVWRDRDRCQVNEAAPPPEDLDALPFPARHLLDWDRYRGSVEFGFLVPRGQRWTHLVGSRGCPFSCTFCASHVIFGRRVRERSVGNILEEIEEASRRWHVNHFTFSDDNFTLREERTREFCEELLRRGLRIRWSCLARVGLSVEILRLMRRAGCALVGMGVESGSEAMLRRLRKGTRLDEIRETFASCREVGIPTKAFFMVGLPGETDGDVQASLRFAKEIKPDFLWLSVFVSLPGTEAYQQNPSQPRGNSYLRSTDPVVDRRYRTFLINFYTDPFYLLRLRGGSGERLRYLARMLLAFAEMRFLGG